MCTVSCYERKRYDTSVIGGSDDDSTSTWESQVELSGDEERAVALVVTCRAD